MQSHTVAHHPTVAKPPRRQDAREADIAEAEHAGVLWSKLANARKQTLEARLLWAERAQEAFDLATELRRG